MTTKELDSQYIVHTYGRADVSFVKGKGSELWDEEGKRYIDLGSGIAVNALGASDDLWVKAVTEQAAQLQHISNLYYTRPMAQLARLLCEKSGMKKVFFGNSGAEANECAIKAARKYGHDHKGEDCNTIITLQQSFHGRTIATLAATGQDVFHTNFGPFPEGFVYVPANDIEAMKKALSENKCAAVMMELVQGEGGVRTLDREYVQEVCKLAHEQDTLIVIDEVQTGNGRTGAMYAYQMFGIEPDIVSTAKGMAGGLPMGACLFNERTENVLTAGLHGSTFGGNPVCAAGAVSIISRIDEELLADVRRKGEYIRETLKGARGVREVSGMGLMVGIAVEGDAKAILARAREMGVVVLTAKDRIRLLPPLNIPMDLLEEAMEILKKAIAECC